jgi:6-pyruvoyl-tetrahydropterin synthase
MSVDMEVSITRKFVASHSLPAVGVAERHEHPYELECGYCATIDEGLGCDRPMQELAAEVDAVVSRLSGAYLNDVLPRSPTAESLACWILDELPRHWEWATIRAYAGFRCTVRRADLLRT